MKKLSSLLVLACLVLASLACGSSKPRSTPTPSIDTSATQAVISATQQAAAERVTAAAQEIQATQQAMDQQSTQEAENSAASSQATADAEYLPTQEAAGMAKLAQDLKDAGYIRTAEGSYYSLKDFDEKWAQLDWYQWWNTDHSPSNFIIQADTEWETASATANLYNSGCGFVFREIDENNHYLAYLGLDGVAYFDQTINNVFDGVEHARFGHVDLPKGSATLLLVVDGQKVTFFINGKEILTRNVKSLTSGNLALTLMSGTNKDFGTHCTMTNVMLWELPEG
jgi:hypothetical protein